jgi:deazaflavin-dependent oxidoreductase (nitroreductase family)
MRRPTEWLEAHHRYQLVMSSTFNDFNRNLIQHLRANGGKAPAGPFEGRELMILTTKGAKSGEVRENPVVYSRDGDRYVVIASKGGAPTSPSWYHNLVAHPEVTVEAKGQKFKALAHPANDEDEYERLYQNHAKTMPAFNGYRQKTTRKIPVVILERLDFN